MADKAAYASTGGMCPGCGAVPRGVTHACLPVISSPPSFQPRPWKCPVCHGKGTVVRGFYDFGPTIPSTTSNPTENCRSCGGRGVIVS